jgi:WXG100 family type VII secretion target
MIENLMVDAWPCGEVKRHRRPLVSGGGSHRLRPRAGEVAISGSISVDLPSVSSAEEGFQQTLYGLEAELDGLQAKLQTSLRAWSGEAQAAYQVAHAQWQAAADDMAKSLAFLHGAIRTAGGNYGSARSANLTMWRGR